MQKNAEKSIFQASKEIPFHISVGVVLTNDDGLICCHLFKKGTLPFESEGGVSDLYLLVRETIENNETIEKAVARGILEELGATGILKSYLGCIKSKFLLRVSRVEVEKTTLYFHVKLHNIDLSLRDPKEVESKSEIKWIKPEDLVDLFIEQSKKYERTDLDESVVIKNYIKYVKTS